MRVFLVAVLAMVFSTTHAEKAPILMAHRGNANGWDENSTGSFRACYEKGIRTFETDVRMTKDNNLVILHDDTLDRTTTGTGPVENLTLEEIKTIKLRKTGEPLPLAQDLMNCFHDKSDVFIEFEMKTGNSKIYTDERVEIYCRLLYGAAHTLMQSKTYCFTSFDKRTLMTMKRLFPSAQTGLIMWGALDDKQIELAVNLGANHVAPLIDWTSRHAVHEAQKKGLRVTGGLVNSKEDYSLAVALGCDYLISDVAIKIYDQTSNDKK